MAGVDKDFGGEASRARRDGRLPRAGARSSTRRKDVLRERRGRRRRDAQSCSTASKRSRQARRADRRRRDDDARRSRRGPGRRSTPSTRWNLDRSSRSAMDALRLPARRRRRRARSPAASGAASRCAGCCSSEPDMLLLDEPTNHLDAESVAWLERYLQEYPGTVVAVTHDRYFLDNVAGWILELDRGQGIPCKGNYSRWLEQKQDRLAQEEKQRVGAPAHARSASSSGSAWRRGPPGQEQGPPRRLREAARRGRSERQRRPLEIQHPAGPAPRRRGRRGRRASSKGFGDSLLDRGPDLLACRPAASSASSARTAPARRRCSA